MKRIWFLVLLIFTGSLLAAPSARAFNFGGSDNSQQSPWLKNAQPFQAEIDTTIIEQNGRKTLQASKYFFMPGKIRTEDLKEGSVFIIDMAKKISYIFSKQSNVWMKIVQQDAAAVSSTGGKTAGKMPEFKSQKLPDAIVDGKVCEVTQYTIDDPKLKSTSVVYVWKGKNLPLKITGVANGTKSEIVYKNISFVKTLDSMFVPPVGAQVLDMSQMMAPKK